MKTCSQCNQYLSLECFDIQSIGKLGRRADCKECRKRFIRSKYGVVKAAYGFQKAKSKKRGYSAPNYSENDLYQWAMLQPEFHEVYDVWLASGFLSNFKPSFDRIDDYVSYTLDNIRIVTWRENNHKQYADRLNGINTKASHAVDMLDISGAFLQRFCSISEAARHFNGIPSNIVGAITQRQSRAKTTSGEYRTYITQTAYGHKWRYSDVPNTKLEKT